MGNAGRKLVILVPVLGRPGHVAPLLESIKWATPEPHRVLFIPDENDGEEIGALVQADAEFFSMPPRSKWAEKINEGYRRTKEPWIFCAADDLRFRRDWYSRALEWAKSETGIIGTNDLTNPRTMTGEHSTHFLVRRSYVEEHGTIDEPDKILHEGYAHEYADDEAVQTAQARGVYVHAFDSLVEHLHPWKGKAPDDETYRLGRSRTRHSKRLFHMRRHKWTND